MFEWMIDPTAWLGLLTLVVLEIILGIDNLLFIAILAEKLPPEQRDRARYYGLALALLMRFGLLASLSHMVSFTQPLFTIWSLPLSGRDFEMRVSSTWTSETTSVGKRTSKMESSSSSAFLNFSM